MSQTKPQLYRDLAVQLRALLDGEKDPAANAANMAALIWHGLSDLNWAGFYFRQGSELVLGPFQGKPACMRIAIGAGVCGTAAAQGAAVVVPDVHEFPGHIACDPLSRSELVVPLIDEGTVLGVLDLDSPLPARFDEADCAGCEELAALFVAHHRRSGPEDRGDNDPASGCRLPLPRRDELDEERRDIHDHLTDPGGRTLRGLRGPGGIQAHRFRELLRRDGMVVAPGAFECITARLVEQAGFEVVYMTGAGTAATFGYPDFGLLTMSEMVGNARRIAAAVDLPVVADADTGYGNELNVFRTVREYETAGVAAIHIEDQGFPKKCGHLDDKEIVAREDWLAKIRAATAARRDPDFVIIARTDARAVAGLDEAVARANAALAAGADMAFVEAPQSLEEAAAVPRLVRGPCLLNVVHGGKTPDLDLRDAEAMGYKLAIVPGLLIKCVIGICEEKLTELKAMHRHPPPPKEMTVRDMFGRVGADEWDARRTQFRPLATAHNAAE